ncbi:hypothetical protein F442_11124 [Phytophthora nicotianae P10297]|uniref:Uncharacterized protein n=1 Tax=Phytophthora nicotianae P10297 TaxID=1317064 RepID=W2Z4B6_PHYNI|nr:hypothetical protein F442_11124 [Phytophthora nicotianae P10297]
MVACDIEAQEWEYAAGAKSDQCYAMLRRTNLATATTRVPTRCDFCGTVNSKKCQLPGQWDMVACDIEAQEWEYAAGAKSDQCYAMLRRTNLATATTRVPTRKASTSTTSPGAMSARLLGYVAMGVASIVAAVFFN